MARAPRQVLVLLACTGGLAALIGQLNHELAPLSLSVFAPGLLIAYASLRLPSGAGLALAVLTGFCLDAAAPHAFGRHAFLLGLAFCLLHRVRARLPREDTLVGVVAALFLNLAAFVALALLDLGALPDPAAGGLRLLADLLVSQVFTALVGPWFFALQRRALILAHASPAARVGRFA